MSLELTRRGMLAGAAGLLAAGQARAGAAVVPFRGAHQAGIVTPAQLHTCFAALDVTTSRREELRELFRRWTVAAERLTQGRTTEAVTLGEGLASRDSADTVGLAPARLTLTFGVGPSLFDKGGVDRFGLAKARPAALVPLPLFPGDQLVADRSDGDLSVQACADDPQVAMHALRELARLAYGVADIRWVQNGFNGGYRPGETPRNLMGFKDGTNNPDVADPRVADAVVWVGAEAPGWMRGGSYVVYRRSRIALEHWDRVSVGFQEQTFGRRKATGAPIGGRRERDAPDLHAVDKDGNPLIDENAHIRLAAAAENGGARILRRAFSYDDGANFVAERWPPWTQAMEFDAGLLFICYQRDPRTGFVKLFERMAKFDRMNQFVTNTASALFACPGGIAPGRFLAQGLFDA